MADILAGAEPFSGAGSSRAGVLVLHGFTGSPQSMRPLAQAFAAAGYTVELPLLPGHGTTVEDMAQTGWDDWFAAADAAYRELAGRVDKVVVAGLSMGGSLTLALALAHPEIAGIVVVNPVVDPEPFAPLVELANNLLAQGEEFFQGVGGDVADPAVTELAYDRMPNRAVISLVEAVDKQSTQLSSIGVPTLLLHSVQDHVVAASSSDLISSRVPGLIERVELPNGFHVATIDLDKDEINRRSTEFAASIAAP
jgi:carboxylesterase